MLIFIPRGNSDGKEDGSVIVVLPTKKDAQCVSLEQHGWKCGVDYEPEDALEAAEFP
jgi:hypothetical protein